MVGFSRRWRVATVVAMFVVLMGNAVEARPNADIFPETGFSVDGPFLTFWQRQGALPVFGYPTSEQRLELNRDTGVEYQTQWFQRNRFEAHPEQRAPYDVLLGRLGDDRLLQLGIDWRLLPREAGPKTNCRWFAETNHNVCDQANGIGFKTYWETHGLQDPRLDRYNRSLSLFGFPLTEAAMETNAAGDTVLTQWFERARFEWHPNNPDQFKVLLGLLAVELRDFPPPPKVSTVDFSEPQLNPSTGFYESTGTFANAATQQFVITVAGQSANTIVAYTNEVQVQLLETLPLTQTTVAITGTDQMPVDALLRENPKNLVIDIEPNPPPAPSPYPSPGFARQAPVDGYAIQFAIDPSIDRSASHYYRARCRGYVEAVITPQQGGVQGSMLRNGSSLVPPRDAPTTIKDSPNTLSSYLLKVTGMRTATSSYKISGTWRASYTALPRPDGTCR